MQAWLRCFMSDFAFQSCGFLTKMRRVVRRRLPTRSACDTPETPSFSRTTNIDVFKHLKTFILALHWKFQIIHLKCKNIEMMKS